MASLGPGPTLTEPHRRSGTRLVARVARWWAVGVFLLVAIVVTVNPPYANTPPIRSDGLGYHAWTRGILDRDLSYCQYDDLKSVATYGPLPDTGVCFNKYPPGLAILRFPVMAPFTAANGGTLRSDAEDTVNQWCAVVAGAAAVLAIVAVSRRRGASALTANASAVAVAFGTGLFHYSTYDGSFTHAYSAAFVGLLLYSGAVYASRFAVGSSRAWPVAGVAVSAGFLVLIRQPLLLVVVGIGGTWLLTSTRLRHPGVVLREHRALLAGTGAAVGASLAVELAHVSWAYGHLTLSSYGGERFLLTQARQLDVVWSFSRGLVVWYPIVAVLVAMLVTGRRWNPLLLVGATTVPLVLLYGAWHSWELGGGFGHRGFVELAPVYGFALACAFRDRSTTARVAGTVAAAAAVFVTLGLMRVYWSGEISFYGIDAAEWQRFGLGHQNFAAETLNWLRRGMR